MTIDWSLAKAGSTAIHRNGGRSVIVGFDDFSNSYLVKFDDTTEWYIEPCDGESPFDIISIEPAPEPVRVTLYVRVSDSGFAAGSTNGPSFSDTHMIEWETAENGKPLCESIKMQEIGR